MIKTANSSTEDNSTDKKVDINLDLEEKLIKNLDFSNIEIMTSYLKGKNPKFVELFELKEFIGSGSESYVYKTIVKKNKRLLSSKIIKREKGEKININEYYISKKLKNKNIIDSFGICKIKEGELDCIMTEYAKYGNLRDFQKKILKNNNLSESLLCYIASQILNGLKYMHMNKITHFDIKPQNLIVDDFLNIKIIDFSVSLDYTKINTKTTKLPFRGTNYYIPPEVNNNKTIKIKDMNKIDLYSLGILLFTLGFGNYPFDLSYEETKDYKKEMEKCERELRNKNQYSWHFFDFLKKILEKDINKRININEALNHYWIKGADILIDEKEKLSNNTIFLFYLITNHCKSFNDYVEKGNKF